MYTLFNNTKVLNHIYEIYTDRIILLYKIINNFFMFK